MADDPNKVATFSFGRAWIDDELGILRLTFVPRTVIYLKDAIEQVDAMQRLTNGNRLPCLVDMREIHKTDREARNYYAGPETAKAAIACAMVIGASGVGTAIGNFMIALYGKKGLFPIKLFTNENDAITWLRSFVVRPDGSRPS